MKRSSGSRKTAELSKSILQQLNMYTRAAGAAGVGVLALSQSAAAKIVYTPANITFGLNQYGKYPIDFNHDGITDLTLSFFHTVRSVGFTSSFREYADRPNSVWRAPVGSRLANCTKAGGIIGRDRNSPMEASTWDTSREAMANSSMVVCARSMEKALMTAIWA